MTGNGNNNGNNHPGREPRRVWWMAAAVAMLLLAHPARGETVYQFGILPIQRGHASDDPRRIYQPLLDYLGARVGTRIVPVSGRSYDDVIEYLVEGRVQLCALSAVAYVVAQRRNADLRVLVGEMSWDEQHARRRDAYDAVILTRSDRADIPDLAALKGHSFAFVDTLSGSGYRYPVAHFSMLGWDYSRFFGRFHFLGSHPRVTDALAAGSVDAGATWDYNLSAAREKHGDIFRVLHRQPVPGMLIAVHPSLPAETQERLRQALLSWNPPGEGSLPAAGYVDRAESFYDAVRALLDQNERESSGGQP